MLSAERAHLTFAGYQHTIGPANIKNHTLRELLENY